MADSQNVSKKVVCAIIVYIVVFALLLFYSIVLLWPTPTTSSDGDPTASPVTFLLWTFSITDESRMILIVAMAGSIGSLIHTFRSAIKYIGERKFVGSWVAFYILLPYIGAALGLVFYFVIRGGFFSPQATVQQTSPFGFAALSGLVGMFSEQAIGKLKHVFEQILTPAKPGKDHYEGKKKAEKTANENWFKKHDEGI
jgi:hypothetical protein